MKRLMMVAMALTMPVVLVESTQGQAASTRPYAGGDPVTGRAYVLQTCTPCHVVSVHQLSPPRFAVAPDFQSIARTPSTTALSLAAFLRSPHPTMPNLILNDDEVRNVIAYILSLRERR